MRGEGDVVLRAFIERHERLFVLTGAGCSTRSGIPAYRDAEGRWKQPAPMTYQNFMGGHAARQRYWARSLIGWPLMAKARPNDAHLALVRLEQAGRCEVLVTQNVDGLHRAAGSRNMIDLHGRLDRVRCMGCGGESSRASLQARLAAANPEWAGLQAVAVADGDARLEDVDFSSFSVPSCPVCGGVLKPDVVFFGENVPKARVETVYRHVEQADAVLVVGSSLTVFSGFRFVEAALRAGKPVAAVTQGRTRADGHYALKIERSCDEALAFLL
jgi:NAD-dependent SIR2 family protein deacetylase